MRKRTRYQREREKRSRLEKDMIRRQQALNQRTDEQRQADEEARAAAERAHFQRSQERMAKRYFWQGDILCVREYGQLHQVAHVSEFPGLR